MFLLITVQVGVSKTQNISLASGFTRHLNPTSVTEAFWVFCRAPNVPQNAVTHGKWLVFKPLTVLDESWHEIRQAVEAGEFGDGCTGAKCSTSRQDPRKPMSPQGVFMVYTTKEGMDEVGLLLIHKVKQTIRYKTDEATLTGLYAHKGDKKITCKTIYWNGGDPSFEKQK